MSPALIQSFIAGSAAAGALTSSLRLITKAAFERSNNHLRKGAIKYYRRKSASEESKTVAADLAAAGIQNQSDLTDDNSKEQRLSKRELLLGGKKSSGTPISWC